MRERATHIYLETCKTKMDLSIISRKFREGVYTMGAAGLKEGKLPSSPGLTAFDNDVRLVGRNALM